MIAVSLCPNHRREIKSQPLLASAVALAHILEALQGYKYDNNQPELM